MQKLAIEGYRLSLQQKHLWLLQPSAQDFPYRAQLSVLIEGKLNPETLNTALGLVVSRHEILRTSFHWLSGMSVPMQTITDNDRPSISQYDWTDLNAEQQQARASALFEEAKRQPFDFGQAPIMHCYLAGLSAEKMLLLIGLPALCADASGLQNLLREIGLAYEACVEGADLRGEVVQYIDLSEWQNELLESEEAVIGKDHWRKKDLFDLPTLNPSVENQRHQTVFNSRFVRRKVGQELVSKMESLAHREKVSLSTLLLACWHVLLWRLIGKPRLIVGTAYDGRKYAELKNTLGVFVKYLPIEYQMEEGLTFTKILEGISQEVNEAYKLQEAYSWDLLADHHVSFFPLCFDYQDAPPKISAGGATFSTIEQYVCADRFAVKLSCDLTGDGLTTDFHYDVCSHSEDQVNHLADHFHRLLESAIETPQSAIDDLEIMTINQREQMLVVFNKTDVDFGEASCLHWLFQQQAEQRRDAVALVCESEAITYERLNRRSNQLGSYLRKRGVVPETLVGICVEPSLEMMVAILGILKAGGAYVPLDPAYPEERLAFILKDAEIKAVLTQERLRERLPEPDGFTLCLDTDWSTVYAESEENLSGGATAENSAYLIYTSGSTGAPKGVVITHRAVCNHLYWRQRTYPLIEEDRFLQKASLGFDISVWELFAPLLAGAQTVIARAGGHQDCAYLVRLISEQGVSTAHFGPALLQVFIEEPHLERCRNLRRVFCGGEALSPGLQQQFFGRLNAELAHQYGPTEACIDITARDCRREGNRRVIPVGRPIDNAQIYILDGRLQPVPIGVQGELHCGGEPLARGYLNRPELTGEKFIPHPFGARPGARMYKTGDVARYLPTGEIALIGRLDYQVKIRGFRIELGEIAAALAEYPAVREAVAVTTGDSEIGDQRLVAYVVLDKERDTTTSALRNFLQAKLPHYMTPSDFVLLERMPLTPSGKIDRKALPAPDHLDSRSAKSFVAPRDSIERELAEVWESLLGVRPIGIKDNFFDLGGNSILAIRLIARMQKKCGRAIPLATLVEGGTVEQMAIIVRNQIDDLFWEPLVVIQSQGSKRPLFVVHPIGGNVLCYVDLSRYLGPEQPFYGLQAPSLEKAGESDITIEQMATHYLMSLRTVQKEGPYLLGGYSFGGMVAFEIARQLSAVGEQVALLALLDSRSPTMFNTLPEYEDDDDFLLTLLAKVLAAEKGVALEVSPDHFHDFDADQKLNRFLDLTKNAGVAPPDVETPFLRDFLKGYRKRQKAMRRYVPDVYDGRLTLFRTSTNDPWIIEYFERAGIDVNDRSLGWSKLSSQPVDIYEIPGEHDRICHEPYVQVLAEQIRACIESASITRLHEEHANSILSHM